MDNPLDKFSQYTETFREVWVRYSKKYIGIKIPANKLAYFFKDLDMPMGFKGLKKHDIKFEVEEGTPEGDEELTIFDIGK